MTRLRFVLGEIMVVLTLATSALAARAQTLSETEAFALATEAYIYGYPLVTMEITRRVLTNFAAPVPKGAPMGQFMKSKAYPTPDDKQVTAPNADTLYSSAWLDLAKEAYVVSFPEQKDRYYLMPMLSGWTDVFQVPGRRTTGDKAQTYVITGPNWKGKIPDGLTEYKSPTALVWIIGRIFCTGAPEDFKAVHVLQDKYSLVPLSAYGKPYTPPMGMVDNSIDMKTPPRDQVNRMDAGVYFKLLAALLKDNPPAEADAAMVAKMAKLGIVPGKDFHIGKLEPAVQKAMVKAAKTGLEQIVAQCKKAGITINGWMFTTKTGLYGTEYLQRAAVTFHGLGANRPKDAVYPTSEVDVDGKKYSGANKYVLRFEKGQTPPAKAFWSITMYDAEYFFVPNPLNRYTLSSRSDFKYNDDGSLDLYFQHEPPGEDKEANWLPAPKGEFVLMLRMYWPSETPPSIFDGTWQPRGQSLSSRAGPAGGENACNCLLGVVEEKV